MDRRRRNGAAARGDLVHHDRRLGDAKARTAVFLGHGDAQPAALGHGAVELTRELAVIIARQPVVVAEMRRDRAHALADRLAFVFRRQRFRAAHVVPPCRAARAVRVACLGARVGAPGGARQRSRAPIPRLSDVLEFGREKERPMSQSDLFEKGLEVRREVLGRDYVDSSLAKADDFMMAFQNITTEMCWGYADTGGACWPMAIGR